jgi:hypothetical protein
MNQATTSPMLAEKRATTVIPPEHVGQPAVHPLTLIARLLGHQPAH